MKAVVPGFPAELSAVVQGADGAVSRGHVWWVRRRSSPWGTLRRHHKAEKTGEVPNGNNVPVV